MGKKLWLIAAVCAASMALPVAASAMQTTPIPGQYIVVLKGGASGAAVAAEHARSAKANVLHTYDAALHGYSARLSAAGVAAVKADPRVASVTQDVEGTPVEAQTLPTGVDRIDADLSTQLAGDGTGDVNGDVAVFDTGIQVDHPDLNVAGGVNCLDSTNTRNDHTYGDQYGHGTHVAGIIGAKDDMNGVVGVAPGVRLWSVRVLDSAASGSISSQLCGINWVTANGPSIGIKVVNSSQALLTAKQDDGNCGYSNGDILHQAICNSTNAGILWVFGAGNSAVAFTNAAGMNYPQVLTVTGYADGNGKPNVPSTTKVTCGSAINTGGKKGTSYTETDDKYASFSDWAYTAGQQAHTVAAPGVCIYSTFLNSTYGVLTGTSMSSPTGAGVAELCVLAAACDGVPANEIQKIRTDAEAYNRATPSFGFTGDPLHAPVSGRYYGFSVRAGQY
jgi:subtilisin family serine protease